MEKYEFRKIFISYLKRGRKGTVVFLLFSAVFLTVFSLYKLPIEAVRYAVLLCAAVGVILFTIDFYWYFTKCNKLLECRKRITLSMEELPEEKELIEQEYQNLIAILFEEKAKCVSLADSSRSDLMDYFTLWVHQIKTPIAAMELLLQMKDSEENAELGAELFKIEQYVEMVLQYLRLDSSSTDYVVKQYELNDIVKQAVRKYAKLFIRKKISLDLGEINCNIITDEKWLVFVIEQIISNALKYTKQGKISIYMENAREKLLVIEDTGIGIRQEDLPRVFEKGYTGYNGRADKKSTGIGLYLCKRILTRLSHTIEINSEVSKGTKVRIGLDSLNVEIE
jgi:Signal transduction histidine kinase